MLLNHTVIQGGQCYNAPVSEHAAFAYTTALNQLIADEKHCKVIGNTTVVYWAADGEEAYQDLLHSAVFEDDDAIDDETLDALFSHIQNGMPFDFHGVPIHPDTPFYILGLSPNAARLSVRFSCRTHSVILSTMCVGIMRDWKSLCLSVIGPTCHYGDCWGKR